MMEKSWPLEKARDWHNQVSPARPSFFEIKIFENFVKEALKKKSKPKLAVLGVTAEFRNLGHAYGLDVTLIEFSKDHYEILSKQPRQHKGPEKLRLEDWRAMNETEKYDLVFGDLVTNVFPKGELPKVINQFAAITARDGRCILRCWVRPADRLPDLLAEIKRHRKERDGTNLYASCAMFFYLAGYDYQNDKADFKKMIGLAAALRDSGKITGEEYHQVADRWLVERTEVAIPRKAEFEKMLRESFQIESTKCTKEVFSRFGPIYVLRKR